MNPIILGQAGHLLSELVGRREAVVDLAHVALLVDENGGGQGENAVFDGRFRLHPRINFLHGQSVRPLGQQLLQITRLAGAGGTAVAGEVEDGGGR